ncbi:MAG: outer membrane protein transport protein, partial [Candidatus Thiosymbion ectosymbiont of Robbea hypermnestra]|nr:outer membrane protein transport protein [Candidatus Thiosymbion ectosymbiont of Robbea hypermnestra]
MNKQNAFALQLTLAGGLGLLVAIPPAFSSGFSVPELSALGMGTANAVVANPEETGAFGYNPAAMGFHDASSVAGGLLLINPSSDLKTASGSHTGKNADWFAAPIFQVALKLHEQWRLGIGLSAPFGLETRWKLGTFPKLSGSFQVPTGLPAPLPAAISVPSGAHPTSSALELVALTPTLAYKVNDDLS